MAFEFCGLWDWGTVGEGDWRVGEISCGKICMGDWRVDWIGRTLGFFLYFFGELLSYYIYCRIMKMVYSMASEEYLK